MNVVSLINWVDILAVIIMLRITYVAFQDGLSHEIFPLIAVICSTVLTLRYYIDFAINLSQNLFNLPIELANFLSFTILFIGISLIFRMIRILLDKVIKVTWHPLVEKFGGIAAGIVRASITTSIVLIIIALIPMSYLSWSIKERSMTGMYFLRIAPKIYEKVSEVVPGIKVETCENIIKNIVKDRPLPKDTTEKDAVEMGKALH